MEGLSTTVYKSLKTYWRRKGYKRLNGRRNNHMPEVRLGQDPNSGPPRRRSWRVKVGKRIKVLRRIGSPKKWLKRLRDAYVNMMLRFANTGLAGPGVGGLVDYGYGFAGHTLKEYDEKVLVEVYKSILMSQGQIVPRDVAKIASQQQQRQQVISAR